MSVDIRIKRGLKENLPSLKIGELAFCTDTKELFIGVDDGNSGTVNVPISVADTEFTFYVAVTGDDNNDGTLNNPFRTIRAACDYVATLDPVGTGFGGAPIAPLVSIRIASGTYLEQLPIVVPPNTALVGENQRTVRVEPAAGLSDDGVTPNNESQMFQMSVGTLASQLALYNMTGWVKPTGVNDDPTSVPAKGVGFALNPASPIFGPSPYILDCSAFFTGGIGAYVDGSVHSVGNKSMLFYAYTNVNDNGIGFWSDNGGVMESVSNFTYYAAYGYLATRGGYIRGLNGSNSWGIWALYATGFLPEETPITGELQGVMLEYSDLDASGSFAIGDDLVGETSGALAQILNVQEGSNTLYIQKLNQIEFIDGETITGPSTFANALGTEFGQKGSLLVLTNLSAIPQIRQSLAVTGDTTTYVVASVSGTYVDTSSTIFVTLAQTKGTSSPAGTTVELRERYSQIRVTGHDFLNIGAGGIQDIIANGGTLLNPGTPIVDSQQTGEFNNGRVFAVSTDQDGNFRVGKFFKIDQGTGQATLDASSFDLSGLSSLRLGSIGAQLGEAINEFSSDVLLSQNSNEKVPTQAAVRAFVAAQISTKADLVNGRVPIEQLPLESVNFRGTFGSAQSTTEGDLPLSGELGDLYIADQDYTSVNAGNVLFRSGDKALWDGNDWRKNEGVAEIATKLEAEAGSINNKLMTPLRTKESIETFAILPDGTNSDIEKLKFENQTDPVTFDVGEIALENFLPKWQISPNTLHLVGQQLITRGINRTGAQVATGAPVYITGVFTPAGPGTNLKEYELASRNTEFATFAIASCPAPNNEEGCIITKGIVEDWNTSSFTAGDDLYLTDTAGQYTTTKPTSGRIVYVGKVIRAANDGIVFINPFIEPVIATQQEAEAGTDNSTFMTPLRTLQAIQANSASVVVSDTAPSSPAEGDLWFDSASLLLFIYFDDGDSLQWIEVTSGLSVFAEVSNYILTINTNDWAGTEPAVAVKTVPGILASDRPIVDIDLKNVPFSEVIDTQNAYSFIYLIDATANNQITFSATEPLSKTIIVNIQVVR